MGGFHFVWRNLGTVTMDLVTYKEYGSTCGKLYCFYIKTSNKCEKWTQYNAGAWNPTNEIEWK